MDEKINELCSMTKNPTTLNALHACRTNHPLGRNNLHKWQNAWACVAQNARAFASVETQWLRRFSDQEMRVSYTELKIAFDVAEAATNAGDVIVKSAADRVVNAYLAGHQADQLSRDIVAKFSFVVTET